MTSSQLYRTGGVLLFAGAVTFMVHSVARSVITAGLDPVRFSTHPLWVPINALGIVGAALVVLGLPGLYKRLVGATGRWPLVGVGLISLAWMFLGLFVSIYAALVAPWLADNAPDLLRPSAPPPTGVVMVFIVALLAELVGTVLFGIPFMRGQLAPRWVGYTLPAAAVLTIAGDLVAPTGPARDLTVNLLSNSGPLLLMATFARLGAFARGTKHARTKEWAHR